MTRTGITIATTLIVALAHASALTATAAAETYTGHLVGRPGQPVEIQIKRDPSGRAKVARFKARRVEVICDDGTSTMFDLGLARFVFQNAKLFSDEHAYYEPDYLSYYEVTGRLMLGGEAQGHLVYLSDSHAVAGTDCSTEGPIRWKAQRVKS